jgi:hypothetical protein
MEDHKVSRANRVSVRNRYTIFLCEEDFDRLMPSRDDLLAKFERHLAKHVRSKRYEIPGEIMVDIVLDTDLRLGHFGILGEREAPGLSEEDMARRFASEVPAEDEWLDLPQQPARPPRREAEPATPLSIVREAPSPRGIAAASPPSHQGGSTRIIAAADAAQLGLARSSIVIRSGNRVREYTQGRVVVGRARDADFRIDNPDVSRRHAAIYWSNGAVVLEDLGSTNGTMVNGYPVSSTAITPQDVVVIGDCRMSVDVR